MVTTAKNKAAAEAETTGSVARLEELSTHRDKAVRAAVARNSAAPTELLVKLAADKSHLVRFAVAQNADPRAWQVALEAEDADVRVILAQRDDLDDQTMERLITAPERAVRVSVVESTRRADVVRRLAQDADYIVRATAATRPDMLSDHDLERLAADKVARVRAVAAECQRLRPVTLSRLASDRSADVRYFVLESHPDRLDLAEALEHDADPEVAHLARQRLAPRRRKPSQ